MSKHFGGGRRLESKEYPPPRRGGIEDKRPSVFDRLGVRKYEDNIPSSHYGGGGGGDGGPYRRNDGPPGHGHRKHSPPMLGRRKSQDARDRIRSRSRSRSFSPRSRKIAPDMGHHHGHGHGHMGGHGPGPGPMRRPKMKEISPHHIDPRMRKRSNSPMRRKLDKPGVIGNSPKWREEGLPPMSRQKGPGINPGGAKKKSSGKKSGKKSAKEKKSGIKGRSSSGSSGTTSSSSRSASSSSSSSEASSSTTSNASSTSDSSVPSIKLKHDKQKRKKMKKPASKSESVSTGQIQSRISSGSSIESGNVRDNRDLREKIKAKTRQNYERMQDGTPPDLRQQRRPPESYGNAGSVNRSYNKPDIRDDSPGSNRRRRPSGSSSLYDDKPMKRRRVLSPEEFVPSPRRAPPPNEQSSVGHPNLRRDRSPPPRDRMRVVQSPMRRAPVEDNRRGDVRGDINKRLDNFGDKPRDMDRFRDEASYSRDNMNRQKERVAPTRLGNVRHGNVGHQMTPDRERDRLGNDRPGNVNRFETRNRPLLQLPHSTPPIEQQKLPFRGSDERVLRTTLLPQSPMQTKHSPMIVKSKEALIEKYRGMKQSQYVDMWVDKTVEACSTPANIVSPPKDNPPSTSMTFNDSIETGTKASSIKDIGELLSDFSDDADELLNDVGDEPKSEKSEPENTTEDKLKEVVIPPVSVADQDATSIGDGASQSEKNPTQVTTPTAPSVLSQDRKSLGTPQRPFIECNREGQSLPSQSQTEDDILERMDFEEISDEELGDVAGENKIPIVDALGVDWASLVCGEKNRPISPSSAMSASSTSFMKVRKRWTPIQVISRVGLINNCSERLLQRVVELKMKEEPGTEGASPQEDPLELEEKLQDELQNAVKLRKIRARSNVIDTIGLGPNSRALSSRRDMALRRYYLGMPQKSLVSMDLLHQNSSSSGVQDMDSIGELYRLSLSLFKGSDTATVAV